MIVYHYCNVDTFYAIIQNKSLRLSDVSKSNDSKEILWIGEKIEELFMHEYKLDGAQYFYKEVDKDTFEMETREYVKTYFTENFNNPSSFVTCFSSSGDLLSQWRGYADDAKGLSLGFEKDFLTKISGNMFDSPHPILIFGSVEYKEASQAKLIKDFAKKIISKIKEDINAGKYDNQNIGTYFYHNFNILFNKSIFLKNPFFKEESEWRIFHRNMFEHGYIYSGENQWEKRIDLNHGTYLDEFHTHIRNDQLVSYRDLIFEENDVI